MDLNTAFRAGYDLPTLISDEKLMRLAYKGDSTPVKIEITRPCHINGEQVEVGKIIELGMNDATDVVCANRAKFLS